MLQALKEADVLGTIVLAAEGINVALAGSMTNISYAQKWFSAQPEFADLWFKESDSTFTPFSKLKVRIRPEIIAFDGGKTKPKLNPAPSLPPSILKEWLDQGRDFILLDARNNYETDSGTFKQARKLDLENFRDFPAAITQLDETDKNIPVVTFCTGGIRCEKAAPWLLDNGFSEVYQVEGGILNYFEQCGGAHWQGDCFVFDDRVEIDPALAETGSLLCTRCIRAASKARSLQLEFSPDPDCEDCLQAQSRAVS